MWLAATLLDSAGLKQAANSPVVSSAGGPAFPTPHRARERQGAGSPGRDRRETGSRWRE